MGTSLGQQERRSLFWVFVAAIVVHVVYLCQYAHSPFFWALELDSLGLDQSALAILGGHVPHTAFFRPPFYAYFLAAVYALAGHSYVAVRLFQAILGSLSCVLLYLLARGVFDKRVGVIAACAMIVYGPIVFYDGEMHTPVWEVFLDLAFLLLCVHAARPGPKPASTLACWSFAGLVLGVSAIVRPNILVALPLALCWIASSHRNSLRLACAFTLFALLAPGLVTLRNYVVARDPVFIASQGGINLYLGNRAQSDGFTPSTPIHYSFTSDYVDSVQLFGEKAANSAVGRRLSASEQQRYWVSKALDWWKRRPVSALTLTWKKWVLSWSHQEIRNNVGYAFVCQECAPFLYMLPVGFWVAAPIGLIGMGLAWRKRDWSRRLTAFTFVYMGSFVPFFDADRFRLPAAPLLLLFGAYALVWLWEQIGRKSWRNVAPAIAACAALAVFVNVDWYQTVTPKTWALDYFSAGARLQALKRYPEAEAQYRHSLRLDPTNSDTWLNLGAMQYYQGRFGEAIGSFDRSIGIDPSPSAYYDMAICELHLGSPAIAKQLLHDALAIDPSAQDARSELSHLGEG